MTRVILATRAAERGGVWKHMLDLAHGYESRGVETAVALPSDAAPGMRDDLDSAGLRTMTLDESIRASADVWHLHLPKSLEWHAISWLWRARLVRGRRVVVTEHLPRVPATDANLPWEPATPPALQKPGAGQAKTALKKLMMRPADVIITVSEHSRVFLNSRYGIPLGKMVAVANGIGPGDGPVAPMAPGELLRVVAVGSLTWRKGFDVLLAAAAQATCPWHIDIIGDGPERAELEAMASRLELVTVTFHGWQQGAAHASAGADVLCLPSRSEAMPYAVLEAMMCGRPVVASAVDGVPELVAANLTGVLVRPEDPSALATALDKLAGDVSLREAMGIRARERLESRFTVQQMVQRTLDAYAS